MPESIDKLIERQVGRWNLERQKRLEAEKNGEKPVIRPIVTISRQRGSRGRHLAEKLAEKLGYELLHREVIDKICESAGYRRRIIESLDDKVRSRIELWFDGVFRGPYIDSTDYFRHLYKVIMSIAEHGGVVVVGRCANFILAHDQGFHIRVVCALPTRIGNLIRYQNFTRDQAEKEIKEFDRSRAELVRRNFRREIDDPQAYDLVINTTSIDIENAVRLAEMGMQAKMRSLGTPPADS